MPVNYGRSLACEEKNTNYYSAYAEETVYQMIVYSKSKEIIPIFCTEKVRFGEQTLTKIIQGKRQSLTNFAETSFVQSEREVTKFTGKTSSVWIFNDLKNKKIIELTISHREDVNPDKKRFVESIDFQNTPTGIEIGDGASQILGDLKYAEESSSDEQNEIEAQNPSSEKRNEATKSDKDDYQGLVIISKPTPRYTDLARKNNVQGRMALRVTFLANGGIGNVSIVSALSHGLTEQAIAVAKKMAFLPTKKNGKTYSVTKVVEYSFIIY
jgi:TonB family protein